MDQLERPGEKKCTTAVYLDETEISIVTFLALARPPKRATLARIAHFLGASTKKSVSLLRRMEEKQIVNHAGTFDGRSFTYGLDQLGHEYAVSRGIVN